MFTKILSTVLLVACAQAMPLDNHGALSTVTFNNHHNTIHHVQSAPIAHKAVTVPVHQAPIHAVPTLSLHSSSSGIGVGPLHHYTAPVASISHTPVVAAPIHGISSGPLQHGSSFSSLSLGHSGTAGGLGGSSLHIAPAVPVTHAAPAIQASAHHVEEYAHPKYEFAYGVEDHHTGDIHSHKEVRDGDVTHGEYSLHESDGTIRTVKYSVDKHSGFNAVVQRTGHAVHVQPAPAKAPVAVPVYNHH